MMMIQQERAAAAATAPTPQPQPKKRKGKFKKSRLRFLKKEGGQQISMPTGTRRAELSLFEPCRLFCCACFRFGYESSPILF